MQILKILLVLSFFSFFISGMCFLVTHLTHQSVIDQMMVYAEAENIPALNERIDYEALRQNLKSHIRAQKKAVQKLGISNLDGGPAEQDIDAVVDFFVQPENMAVLFHLKNRHFGQTKPQAFLHNDGFLSPLEPLAWKVTFGLPVSVTSRIDAGDPRAVLVSRAQSSIQVTLVFRLDGLVWRAQEMYVPLFLVPRRPYNRPLVEVFRLEER